MAALQYLHGIDVVQVQDSNPPITTQRSSVIGVIGTAGKGPVNKPTLIAGNAQTGVQTFGPYRGDGFTIPAALDAIFQQSGSMVIVVNVMDPETITAVTNEVATFKGNTLTLANPYNSLLSVDPGTAPATKLGTFTAQPAVNDTIGIGGKTYKFVSALTDPNDVLIGVNLAATIANLVHAVNGAAGAGSTYQTSTTANVNATLTGTATTITASSIVAGTAGNSVAISESSANFSWAGAATNLSGGGTGAGITSPYVVASAGTVTVPANCTLVSVKNAAGTTLDSGGISALTVGQPVTINYIGVLVLNTDYTIDATTGIVTRLSGGKILPNSTLAFSYSYVDPTGIEDADIIGAIQDDGSYTGMQCLLASQSTVFLQPRILCAPGFTHQKPDAVTLNAVAAAFEAISDRLRAVVILDTPNNTKEEAAAYAADFGKARFYCHYPFYRVAAPYQDGLILDVPASAFIAGMISKRDNEQGFWWSPSNQLVNGIVGLSKPIDFSLEDPATVSNYLNSLNVTCTISANGIRLWGNRGLDGSFLCVTRTGDIIADSIAYSQLWAIDRPITKGFIQQVLQSVNAYIRTLIAQGAIIDGKAWADPALNTPDVIASGHVYIDYDYGPTYPAEHVTLRAHINNGYLTEILDPSST